MHCIVTKYIVLSRMKQNKLSKIAWLFILIIIISQIALRALLWHNHIFFNGEQVRDYTIVQEAWQNKSWIFLGPLQANTGGLYLGPLYYYLLLFFALPFNFHPLAGHILIAALWLAALVISFIFIYKNFNRRLAYLFCMLLMLSENLFLFSSYPLNTNVLFIFTALYIIAIYKWLTTEHARYVYLIFISLTFLLHCHLAALALLPMLVILAILYYRKLSWHWLAGSFLLLFLNLQNNFSQLQTWKNFLLNKEVYTTAITENATTANTFFNSLQTWLTTSLLFHAKLDFYSSAWLENAVLLVCFILIAAVIGLIVYLIKNKRGFLTTHPMLIILTFYTGFILTATMFIHTSLARHYLLIIFIPLLILAILLNYLSAKNFVGKIIAIIILLLFAVLNINNVKIDLNHSNDYPLNAPFEGFSNIYNEENQLAKNICQTTKNKKGPFMIKTNSFDEELKLTMKYLIDYHNNFRSIWPKNSKDESSYTILILYQDQLTSRHPDINSENFNVYFLTDDEYKKIIPDLFGMIKNLLNNQQVIARGIGRINNDNATNSLEAFYDNYHRGLRRFEIDLIIINNELSLAPSNKSSEYTIPSFADIKSLAKKYPDTIFLLDIPINIFPQAMQILVSDLKNENKDFLARFWPIAHSADEIEIIKNHHLFPTIVYEITSSDHATDIINIQLVQDNQEIKAVVVPRNYLSWNFIAAIRRLNRQTYVATYNDPLVIKELLKNKITGIYSDYYIFE